MDISDYFIKDPSIRRIEYSDWVSTDGLFSPYSTRGDVTLVSTQPFIGALEALRDDPTNGCEVAQTYVENKCCFKRKCFF